LTQQQPVNGEVPDPWQWVVHKNRARSAPLHKASRNRIAAFWVLFKKWGIKGWTIFCDRYGVPTRLGKYPKHADQAERDAILQAAVLLGHDGAAAIPVDAMIELVEGGAGKSSQLPHPPLAQFCNAEISKAVLGNTLTTEVGNTGGNRALGEVHESNEEILASKDAALLADTIRKQLATPIVRFNMSEGTPIPRISFVHDEAIDLKAASEVDKNLIAMGVPLSISQLREIYGRHAPEDDEDTVGGPAAIPEIPDEPEPEPEE
jgi:phage gp29-like protein